MKHMKKEELLQYIVTQRDKNSGGWQDIADAINKSGYKSPRTGKPISAMTVRFKYYQFYNEQDKTAEDVKKILAKSLSAEQKIKMITEYLELGF